MCIALAAIRPARAKLAPRAPIAAAGHQNICSLAETTTASHRTLKMFISINPPRPKLCKVCGQNTANRSKFIDVYLIWSRRDAFIISFAECLICKIIIININSSPRMNNKASRSFGQSENKKARSILVQGAISVLIPHGSSVTLNPGRGFGHNPLVARCQLILCDVRQLCCSVVFVALFIYRPHTLP